MTYEVEQKFRLVDPAEFQRRLVEQGVTLGEPLVQSDRYFNHPARDFAVTDEALRVRTVGDQHVVTYKGPKLGTETKTRREIELPLATGPATADEWHELLVLLGFRPSLVVRKQRRTGELRYGDREFEIALDNVDGLGTFVELETLAEPAELTAAQQALLALAKAWQLDTPERRSYLQMLLELVK